MMVALGREESFARATGRLRPTKSRSHELLTPTSTSTGHRVAIDQAWTPWTRKTLQVSCPSHPMDFERGLHVQATQEHDVSHDHSEYQLKAIRDVTTA